MLSLDAETLSVLYDICTTHHERKCSKPGLSHNVAAACPTMAGKTALPVVTVRPQEGLGGVRGLCRISPDAMPVAATLTPDFIAHLQFVPLAALDFLPLIVS